MPETNPICRRCGAVVIGPPAFVVLTEPDRRAEAATVCQDCAASFANWLRSAPALVGAGA